MAIPLSVLMSGSTKYRVYSDDTYTYHCATEPGTALSEEAWQIRRQGSDESVDFAEGTAEYIHAATDLATVQAYDYS